MEEIDLMGIVVGKDVPDEIHEATYNIVTELGAHQLMINHVLIWDESALEKDMREKIQDGNIERFIEIEAHMLNNVVLPGLFKSLFVSAYNLFEDALNKICYAYESYSGETLSYKDLYGNGVARSVSYFEKVIGLEIKHKNQWARIQKWNQVRNSVVHKNGRLEGQQINAAKMLGIEIMQDHYENILFMQKSNLNNFIFDSEKFLEIVIKSFVKE
ncbi:hypothetical protein [Pontibacillus salipaludis]|uniref:Apea-like HEPN domain-containing protein n=1 Tax=Pontibacillus salipaludis TaxID=1697394 RepID=A0ABQ1PI98_9BACI|nr:hypothetical protein [Pontibacillus salipaludis]GGC97797.1 hypothetical protein GCM10011389_01160 [Pontibacillus salipaludis]